MFKKNLVLFLTILACSFLYGQNGQKNYIDENYIEVVGSSEIELIPDEIYLSISIREKDYKGSSAEELEKKMISKLESLGIDIEKNLSINDLMSNFKSYWLKKKEVKSQKEYRLIVNTAELAGKVIEELEKINISNINIAEVDHSEIEKHKIETKVKAVKAAKFKATQIANALDQQIGRAIHIIEIEEQNISSLLEGRITGVVISGNRANYEVPQSKKIEFEKIKLVMHVAVKFNLN